MVNPSLQAKYMRHPSVFGVKMCGLKMCGDLSWHREFAGLQIPDKQLKLSKYSSHMHKMPRAIQEHSNNRNENNNNVHNHDTY